MSVFTNWMTSPNVNRIKTVDLPVEPEAPSSQHLGEIAYVDRGMPLPESYEVDVVRALVQDPFHIMVYWELSQESVDGIEELFGPGSLDGFQPTLRLTEINGVSEAMVAVPLSGKYWFTTIPSRKYRIDVGLRSPSHGFVPVVRSNVVETPRGTVAEEVDPDPDYTVDTPRFVHLLEKTGFASDRILVDVALADAARTETPAAPVDSRYDIPDHMLQAFHRLPDPVRLAAVSIARGETLSSELVDTLPLELRAVLNRFLENREYGLLAAAFMHLLPQLLRQILDGGLVPEATHPIHMPPRYAIGGSEQIQKHPVDWSWLPSMVEALSRRAPRLEPDALDPITSV